MSMNELWKDVPGYEGFYQVSNLGRVKSLDRIDSENHFRKGQIMNLKIIKGSGRGKGYVQVGLRNGKGQRMFSVHRLVALAFIPNPDNLPQVNHKDCNPGNNCVYIDENGNYVPELSNLEWCDAKYNINYGNRNKKVSEILKGRKNTWSAKSVSCFSLSGEYICSYESIAEVSKVLGIPGTNISAVCLGKKKTAGGYKWKYVA